MHITTENLDVPHVINEIADQKILNEIQTLNFICAESLRYDIKLPDELVQGVLLSNGLSIIYGDSNCGKTFFAIDMACAISLGQMWMGKNVKQGLIVYLASEAPGSVEMRLHAYQKYFGISLPNFFIVKKSINLFEKNDDKKNIINLIHYLEKEKNQKVKLIIGDTLASISAGANENLGEHMGIIINNAGDIRNECNTHLCLIHHSGKNIAAGARGWSGIRAAVDTEIEVKETPLGKCAEITKLRDIGKKGEKFGFRLIPTVIGINEWKEPVTSCIVQNMDAPPLLEKGKRPSDIAGAIIGYLTKCESQKDQLPIQTTRKVLINEFGKRYPADSIRREIRKLKEKGQIIEYKELLTLRPTDQ